MSAQALLTERDGDVAILVTAIFPLTIRQSTRADYSKLRAAYLLRSCRPLDAHDRDVRLALSGMSARPVISEMCQYATSSANHTANYGSGGRKSVLVHQLRI